MVTGAPVLGITYADGIILAADMQGSYGSHRRYKNITRLHPVNKKVVIGVGGDLSDYQHI